MEKIFIILYTCTFFQDFILSKLTESQQTQRNFFWKGQVGKQGEIICLEKAARLFMMTYAYNFTRYLF
jgi:hypothetical protein